VSPDHGDDRRLALAIGHVPHAGASDAHPGSEDMRVGLQVPLDPR
jgi:hypothetical protein